MNDPIVLDVADEVGFLIHPEFTLQYANAFWYLFDQWNNEIPGRDKGLKRIYEGLVRRDWNHPSVIIWGLDNELMTQKYVEREWAIPWMEKIVRWMKTVDPTRPATFDGALQVNHEPWMEYATLHGGNPQRVAQWQKWTGEKVKPLNISEIYSDYIANETLQHTVFQGQKNYWDVAWQIAQNFRGQLLELQKRDVSGLGPWVDLPSLVTLPGQLLGEKLHTRVKLPPWPALSGASCKAEYAWFSFRINSHHVNWYDSRRPKIAPNPMYHVIRDTFQPMPLAKYTKRPEIIVAVTRNGLPQAGVNVFLRPLEGQATNIAGVRADMSGRAWFFLPEGGRYEIFVTDGQELKTSEVQPRPPGEWGQVETIEVELGERPISSSRAHPASARTRSSMTLPVLSASR